MTAADLTPLSAKDQLAVARLRTRQQTRRVEHAGEVWSRAGSTLGAVAAGLLAALVTAAVLVLIVLLKSHSH
ncbi:MAG: hypothetical protein ACR2KJ_09050 [Jatrophihabitans sp.]